MDRLLKQRFTFCPTSRRGSSDRLMDRLLKRNIFYIRNSFFVRVTVWWIDYWNTCDCAEITAKTVRVTVWWIDYWNWSISSVQILSSSSSDRLMDRLLKQAAQNHRHSVIGSSDRLMDRLLSPWNHRWKRIKVSRHIDMLLKQTKKCQ